MKKIILAVCLLGLCAVSLNAYSGGDGTSANPYLIANWTDLQTLGTDTGNWDKYFEQTGNITASGTWTPIGNDTTPFTGSYDGGGFTISGLYIDDSGSSYLGLFGYIYGATGATIRNVGVIDCNITGYNAIGGLIGWMGGGTTVTGCYTTGDVSTASGMCVGGLVGWQTGGTVTNCYSTGSVSGYQYVGGFIGGHTGGTVTNCYSTGSVSGEQVGGFIGLQAGGSSTACYWDTETSGQSTSAAGTGRTTAEMKTQGTFTGWDFTNTWSISAGYNDGYPYLDDNNTLPVTLSTFTAQFVNNTPTLYWETQSEEDNLGWNVYRHTMEDFSSATKLKNELIDGHGTTTQVQSYIYEDTIIDPHAGDVYYYWLESVDYGGMIHHYSKIASITIPEEGEEPGVTVPQLYDIIASPNPFNTTTTIKFTLSADAVVDVAIYDVRGALVKTFDRQYVRDDESIFTWNGRNDQGHVVSNGVYFYSIQVNGTSYETKQLILMK